MKLCSYCLRLDPTTCNKKGRRPRGVPQPLLQGRNDVPLVGEKTILHCMEHAGEACKYEAIQASGLGQ
jgi:hypothetical protein